MIIKGIMDLERVLELYRGIELVIKGIGLSGQGIRYVQKWIE